MSMDRTHIFISTYECHPSNLLYLFSPILSKHRKSKIVAVHSPRTQFSTRSVHRKHGSMELERGSVRMKSTGPWELAFSFGTLSSSVNRTDMVNGAPGAVCLWQQWPRNSIWGKQKTSPFWGPPLDFLIGISSAVSYRVLLAPFSAFFHSCIPQG